MQVPNVEDTSLIISSEPLDMSSKTTKLLHYFKTGGNVLCPIQDQSVMKAVRGICFQSQSTYDKFWVKQSSSWINPKSSPYQDLLTSQFKQFCTVTEKVPKLSKAVIWPNVETVPEKIVQQTKLLLDFNEASKEPTDTYLPIVPASTSSSTFNFQDYANELKTDTLGQTVIHAEVVNSTFDILEGPMVHNGLVVIADQQIQGRGRGNNTWISPLGCAMTSFQLRFNVKSSQGQKASLLQHLVSLAVVTCIDTIPLKLKWPNDIYYSKIKMGGVVVLSSVFKDVMVFNIGLGFNLDNAKPTLSLNALLENENERKLSRESYFARLFNTIEKYLQLLETPQGLESLLNLYHQHWLHQDQVVSLIQDDLDSKVDGVVKCIDEFGYIVVQLEDGTRVSVQPGTNSFDMMQGLILPKRMKI